MDYRKAFGAVTADPRYLAKLDWGEARPGHPEGTVRAHIAEIEPNLEQLRAKLSDEDYWKLKLLVHTHDSFKAESKPGVAITDPKSHASLARAFFESHCDDADLLAMVQYHDEPFALFRFHFPDGVDNSGFVGWLASLLKEELGTGVFVTCGSNSLDGGIFDYWGIPSALREQGFAVVRKLCGIEPA